MTTQESYGHIDQRRRQSKFRWDIKYSNGLL